MKLSSSGGNYALFFLVPSRKVVKLVRDGSVSWTAVVDRSPVFISVSNFMCESVSHIRVNLGGTRTLESASEMALRGRGALPPCVYGSICRFRAFSKFHVEGSLHGPVQFGGNPQGSERRQNKIQELK